MHHSHSVGAEQQVGLLSAAASASSRQVGLLAGHYMSSSTSSPSSSTTPPSSSSGLAAASASSPIAANASLSDNGAALSHTSSGHQAAWPQACLDTFSSAAAYNGQQAMAAAQAAAREAFYGSHWASSLGYAANANANAAMMNPSWNSYTLATYQGLQREGVTYGKYIRYIYKV